MPLLCGYNEGDDLRGTVSRRCAARSLRTSGGSTTLFQHPIDR
jgi:hypothetical protein